MRPLIAALFLTGAGGVLLRPNPTPRLEVQYQKAQVLFWDGEFDKAAKQAHIARQPSEWYWRFRLLEAEALIEGGDPDAGVALLKAESSGSPEFEIRRRTLTARRQIGLSKFGSASALLAEARQLAGLHSRPDLEAEIDLGKARLLGIQDYFAEAEAALTDARRSAEAVGDRFHVASSLNNIGVVRQHQFRWEEAIPLFEQAEQLFLSTGARHWAAAASDSLVTCYSRLGDFDKALTYRKESQRLMHPSVALANAVGETGTTYVLLEEPAKAIPYFRQARDIARSIHSPGVAARWAGNLSEALVTTGDWDGADKALQEAISLGPEPISLAYLELDAAAIARGRGLFSKARDLYGQAMAKAPGNPEVLWDAYAGIANTWVGSGDAELANRNFEAAIHVIEGHQSDLSRSQNKITFLSSLIRFYQDYVGALVTQNQRVKALAVADGSRARVLSQRFDQHLPAAAPRQEAEFKTIARRSGSVWLSYWLAPNGSFLWVTTPKEIRFFPLEASSAEIASLVQGYRDFVETIRDPFQADSEAGRKLYKILISPAANMIPSGSSVIVVPDGPLHQLSFATLPVYGEPNPHYWIEDAAVSIAPSFGVFRGERQRPGAVRRSLVIGDASPVPGFPRLESAGTEIETVKKHLSQSGHIKAGVTTITGDAAKPEIWKQADPGTFDIIHFAAHAEANPRSPLDSAIILSPGSGFRLYARDIIDLPLYADLVTLSACRSSGARTYAGEGLVGLTWAFLQAGSRNVVAGLWDVADESTSQLMDRFYAGIAKGTDPADALRDAQLHLLRHNDYPQPFYWGAFQCYRR